MDSEEDFKLEEESLSVSHELPELSCSF